MAGPIPRKIDKAGRESHLAGMTYEYLCSACAHQWEAEQPMSAPPLTTCPSCHAETAKRQVSGGTGFILRGGGWYADGYGSKKPESAGAAKPAASAGDPAPTKKESAASTSETTPAKTESTSTKTEAAPAKSDKASTGS